MIGIIDIDVEVFASSAYKAYGQTVDFKNYQGKPMPKFDDLPPVIKNAWCNAVKQVMLDSFDAGLAKPAKNNG